MASLTKRQAHHKVLDAIRRGSLIRPDKCSRCGKPDVPMKDGRSSIQARLQEQVETQRIGHQLTAKEATDYLIRAKNAEAGLEEMTRSCLAERTGRLAAEAERDRLRELVREVFEGHEGGWIITDTDLVPADVAQAFFAEVAAVLQKEPQP